MPTSSALGSIGGGEATIGPEEKSPGREVLLMDPGEAVVGSVDACEAGEMDMFDRAESGEEGEYGQSACGWGR